jgi:uncharacterized protein (TIGR02594 family)
MSDLPRLGYASGGTPYDVARSFQGQHEGRANELLNRFLNGDTAGMTSAEFAWCSRFAKQAALQGGVPASALANVNDMARSWLKAGQAVTEPQKGDVVVMSRGDPNSGLGHVGFYDGPGSEPGKIRVLAGNQGDAVSVAEYPISRVLPDGYRRLPVAENYDPATGQQGLKPLAMISGTGREPKPLPAPTEVAQASVVPEATPKFDLTKLASLFADDQPKIAPPQLSPVPVNAFQSSPIGAKTPYTFANGGQVRGGSSGEPIHAGPLHSTVPGRTDHLPITVAEGSFVLPADVVSGLGQGNTNAGMQVVEQMFPLPRIRRMSGGRVPIAAAGGEFVIHPDTVAQLGGGDLSKGHKALDDFVLRTRAQTINKLRALPPPEKS